VQQLLHGSSVQQLLHGSIRRFDLSMLHLSLEKGSDLVTYFVHYGFPFLRA
jgi:hypothetical protein